MSQPEPSSEVLHSELYYKLGLLGAGWMAAKN